MHTTWKQRTENSDASSELGDNWSVILGVQFGNEEPKFWLIPTWDTYVPSRIWSFGTVMATYGKHLCKFGWCFQILQPDTCNIYYWVDMPDSSNGGFQQCQIPATELKLQTNLQTVELAWSGHWLKAELQFLLETLKCSKILVLGTVNIMKHRTSMKNFVWWVQKLLSSDLF